MQQAENLILGQTQKGGAAAIMQSAATKNEQAGSGEQGVTVTETDILGARIITESIAGQVLGEYRKPAPVTMTALMSAIDQNAVTIGEALEAVALTAGEKAVDESDAAAIEAAEVRATGRKVITPGGVAAAAQHAASVNARIMYEEGKIKLGDVLTNATVKMSADKAVTPEDAEGVIGAETIAAAARMNKTAQTG